MSQTNTTPGFLAERLATAKAVPAEQRSADARAFIETCRLQAELVQELGLPEEIVHGSQLERAHSRWTAAGALKLVRCHFISPGGPLEHSPQLHFFAINMMFLHTSVAHTGLPPHDLGQEWVEILEGDPCLESFAVLAAALPSMKPDHWERGLLKMSNRVVALMQQPGVQRRLRAEFAALPEQWVSYEELLAFFVDCGARLVTRMARVGERPDPEIRTAQELAVELLPQLAPDNPGLRYRAALMDKGGHGQLPFPATMAAALEVARQQGSDYYFTLCAYLMAASLELWAADASVRRGVPPPGAVLGWLLEAEAAHRRCRALLPKQWTAALDNIKAAVAPAKASLQRLQREGDRWRQLSPAERRELDAALETHCSEIHKNPFRLRESLTCSGCGRAAAQIRKCGACREAQYCSTECQRAHWREHKARCKEVQAARAAAPAGASASGSGGS